MDDYGYWDASVIDDAPFCSECETYALRDPDGDYAMTNFCPECGVRMLMVKGVYGWRELLKHSSSAGNTRTLKYEPVTV